VEDVTIFGNSLHLLVPETIPDDAIRRDLSGPGGAGLTIRGIPPSLEDVFVRLTALQAEEAGAGGPKGARA
jgi:hypothetical protein